MKKLYNNVKRSLLLLLWMASAQSLFAQERVVTGTVKDENNNPIEGAVVTVKNSGGGVVTDKQGKFQQTLKS